MKMQRIIFCCQLALAILADIAIAVPIIVDTPSNYDESIVSSEAVITDNAEVVSLAARASRSLKRSPQHAARQQIKEDKKLLKQERRSRGSTENGEDTKVETLTLTLGTTEIETETEQVEKVQRKQSPPEQQTNAQESSGRVGRFGGKQTLAQFYAERGPIKGIPVKKTPTKVERTQPSSTTSQANNDFPFAYPSIRYLEWDKLSEMTKKTAKQSLRYTPSNWNNLGRNMVESLAFSGLTPIQAEGARLLTLDENRWDCFVNHYSAHDWKHLKEIGLDQHFNTLGWTKGETSFSKSWTELSNDQKYAASQLCYFEEVWDKQNLSDWE